MKVTHVINSLHRGGAEMRVVDLINHMKEVEVSLVCLRGKGPLRDNLSRDIEELILKTSGYPEFYNSIRLLTDYLNRTRPDLVHTHLVQASIIGRLAARAAKVPVVISTQHNAFHRKQDSFLYSLERATWTLNNGFIALSAAVKDYVLAEGFRGSVEVIYTGIDADQIEMNAQRKASSTEYPTVFSAGQLRDKQKGIDVLIEAFSQIAHYFPGTNLCIAGDGPERNGLLASIASKELSSRITLLGERADIPALMKNCQIFVLASRWEGFGRVLLEAMAVGCAIIATRVEAIPEILQHGETALLVNPDDPTTLAQYLAKLISDRHLREELGRRAWHEVRTRFKVHSMCEQEMLFYERLLRIERRE